MSARLEDLQGDEREIAEEVISRIDRGREGYGPWRLSDGRYYPREALEEVVDALTYSAAELVRLRRVEVARSSGRRRRVYVCHPFGGDPEGNARKVRVICRALVEGGHLPIAPHLYLPAFVDERDERDLAIALCLELVVICDEVWVYRNIATDGMRLEVEAAMERGIPVRYRSDHPAFFLRI